MEKKGGGQLQTPSPLTLDLDEKKFLSFFVGEEREERATCFSSEGWTGTGTGKRSGGRADGETPHSHSGRTKSGGSDWRSRGREPDSTHAKPNKEERL